MVVNVIELYVKLLTKNYDAMTDEELEWLRNLVMEKGNIPSTVPTSPPHSASEKVVDDIHDTADPVGLSRKLGKNVGIIDNQEFEDWCGEYGFEPRAGYEWARGRARVKKLDNGFIKILPKEEVVKYWYEEGYATATVIAEKSGYSQSSIHRALKDLKRANKEDGQRN